LGYITGYRDIGSVNPISTILLKTVNNDFKVQNPGFIGNYFPPYATITFGPSVSYSTQYGTAPSQTFVATLGTVSLNVLVYATGTVAATGSVLMGTNYTAGSSPYRLGQSSTTFLVSITGAVNKFLSLWYRVKATPTTATGNWNPVLTADATMGGGRTYERVTKYGLITVSVDPAQVIEFGLTTIDTNTGVIGDVTHDFIYGGSVSVTAVNIPGV
jgi:hypothetical protein